MPQLAVMIESDPTILGTSLLLIGRRVPADYGKFIDLLAVHDEGELHVLELKQDRTPAGGRGPGPRSPSEVAGQDGFNHRRMDLGSGIAAGG
jgi:hypothetical protein